VESKFDDGMVADVIAADDQRSFPHRSKTRLSATNSRWVLKVAPTLSRGLRKRMRS